jgi:hypothetical protein
MTSLLTGRGHGRRPGLCATERTIGPGSRRRPNVPFLLGLIG